MLVEGKHANLYKSETLHEKIVCYATITCVIKITKTSHNSVTFHLPFPLIGIFFFIFFVQDTIPYPLKTLRIKHKCKSLLLKLDNDFLNMTCKVPTTKGKKKQINGTLSKLRSFVLQRTLSRK